MRVGLGEVSFPTNLEAPIAFPLDHDSSCQLVIPLDDVANDEEFIQSPSQPTCPKDGKNKLPANPSRTPILTVDNGSISIPAKTQPDDNTLWINPDNWLPALYRGVNSAVPHVERIPCSHDTLQFPSANQDYVVVLPNKKISVARMIYSGTVSTYTRSSYARHKYYSIYAESLSPDGE